MEFICKIKEVYKSLYTFEKAFSDDNGITINEGMILCCLKDGKSRTAAELAEFIGLSNSRVSRIITTVEEKRYIAREMGSTDKRQMIFSLTKDGKKKVKQMLKKELSFDDFLKSLNL